MFINLGTLLERGRWAAAPWLLLYPNSASAYGTFIGVVSATDNLQIRAIEPLATSFSCVHFQFVSLYARFRPSVLH